jgi:hypothetical protein
LHLLVALGKLAPTATKEAIVMKGRRRLFPLLLAGALAAALVPAAQGVIFERFRFVDERYSDEAEVCGIDVQIEGTATGHGLIRAGTGKRATAFFQHLNVAFSETWTAATGRSVTVTGRFVFNEVKAVPLGGNLFRFTAIQAGQPFRLYDSQGNLVLRDRGVIRFSIVFDTLGDATPGGIVVEELEPSVRGPHPGFDDETLCPVLVPLLAGP